MIVAAAASKALGPKDIGRCATEMLGDLSRSCPAVVLSRRSFVQHVE